VKQMFGGIGQNFVNPALTARIVMMVSFPTSMSTWNKPFYYLQSSSDALTTASPLAQNAAGEAVPSYIDLFLGLRAGCLGETCVCALLLGGVYLVARRVIKPVIPLCFIAPCSSLPGFWEKILCFRSFPADSCWAPFSWLPTIPPPP